MKRSGVLFFICFLTTYLSMVQGKESITPELSQPDFSFQTIDTDHGLPENQVRSLFQLKDGRMLIITEGTFTLYNGGTFKALHYLPSNLMSIIPPYVDCMQEIEEKVWIRSGNKFSILDLKKEQLIENPQQYVIKETGIKEGIKDILFDNEQYIWLFTTSDKLYYYSIKKKELTPVPHTFQSTIFEVVRINGSIYLILANGKMVCLDEKNLQTQYVTLLTKKQFTNSYFNCSRACIVEDGFYWGYRDPEGNGHLIKYQVVSRTQQEIYTGPDRFQSICRMSDGRIAAAAYSSLYLFDPNGHLVSKTNQVKSEDGRILSGLFNFATTDNQDGLWITFSNRGLLYYSPQRIRFQTILSRQFPNPEKEAFATTLYPLNPKELLIGTSNGALVYNLNTQAFSPYAPGLRGIHCLSFSPTSDKELWFCTVFKGTYYLKRNEKPVPLPLHSADGKIPQNVRAIQYFPHLGHWLLSREFGASRFNPESCELKPLLDSFPELGQFGLITHATLWNSHSILFASQSGLFVYDTHKKRIFYPEGDRPGALFKCRNQKFNSILRDRRGWFWLGTHDGLNLYLPDRKKFYTFSQQEGLANNTIQTVAEGKEKNIVYVATSNGLSLLTIDVTAEHPVTNIQNLNANNGLVRGEYCERSFCVMPDGTLFFGGVNGISILTPEMLKERGKSLTPLFSSFQINDQEVRIGKEENILTQSIVFTRFIELSYTQNSFTVEFAAPHYANPTLTRYRYRLLGDKNEKWTPLSSKQGLGSISFHSLPPGHYRLEVEAASFNQSWCKEPAVLEIMIHPPFYWNPIAFLVYIVLASGIAYSIFFMRRRERKLLKALALQEERNDKERKTETDIPQFKPTFDPKDLCLASLDEKFMQRVLDALEKNMSNPDYGVEELSSQIGMVRVTLYRKLKSITGQTPVVFIRTLRLKRAAQYLKAGESITNVADLVGFSDAQYFRKCFKEMYGINPKTYQEEQQKK